MALSLMSEHSEPVEPPRWEHGFRCHGFWSGTDRLGHVGLSPRGFPVVYTWALDEVPSETGESFTLRAAKRRVEAAYRRHYSWHHRSSQNGSTRTLRSGG